MIMEGQRIGDIELGLGLLLLVHGVTGWWWSKQLLWILIYPPPLAKLLLDSLPYVFGGLGTFLVLDGVRRKSQARHSARTSRPKQ